MQTLLRLQRKNPASSQHFWLLRQQSVRRKNQRENATMVDAMVTVQTVPRIMVTAMAAGIMATIMCTAVSLVAINAAAKWTKERCGCLEK
jgi:Na+(H+)/acetate symporter ActP